MVLFGTFEGVKRKNKSGQWQQTDVVSVKHIILIISLQQNLYLYFWSKCCLLSEFYKEQLYKAKLLIVFSHCDKSTNDSSPSELLLESCIKSEILYIYTKKIPFSCKLCVEYKRLNGLEIELELYVIFRSDWTIKYCSSIPVLLFILFVAVDSIFIKDLEWVWGQSLDHTRKFKSVT